MNKTIIDYAQMHSLKNEESKLIIPPTNQVCICKKMHSPCKLVGFCGRKEIKGFRIDLERSDICWKVDFLKVPKLSKKILKCREILLFDLMSKM